MLTLKVISQETEKVLKGLEKKHFKNAQETIEKVLELDKERRAAQQELDNVLAQNKQLAAKIGQLMKSGAADVTVLQTMAKWYGVTYHEDKATVQKFISDCIADNVYPGGLWK